MAGLAKKCKIFELWVRVDNGMSQVINPPEYGGGERSSSVRTSVAFAFLLSTVTE